AFATFPSIAAPAAAPDVSMNFLRFMVLIIKLKNNRKVSRKIFDGFAVKYSY
ncbi:MAG: hypothetical protein H6Q24_462, partial [Bacteroidetes bacterium]|nr:hypothetical protein [Bacteroidota bacterium]